MCRARRSAEEESSSQYIRLVAPSSAYSMFSTFTPTRRRRDAFLPLPPERAVQQRLEQVLRLAFGLALLGADSLVFADDPGELALNCQRRLDQKQPLKLGL